jgi:hypothetical protein
VTRITIDWFDANCWRRRWVSRDWVDSTGIHWLVVTKVESTSHSIRHTQICRVHLESVSSKITQFFSWIVIKFKSSVSDFSQKRLKLLEFRITRSIWNRIRAVTQNLSYCRWCQFVHLFVCSFLNSAIHLSVIIFWAVYASFLFVILRIDISEDLWTTGHAFSSVLLT